MDDVRPRLWSDPSFARYLAATFVNFIGIGVQGIAVPWMLLMMTGDAVSVGVLLVVRALPGLLLAGHAGHLADSRDRRMICLVATLAQGAAELVVVGLGAVTTLQPFHLYAMTIVVAAGNAYFFPASRAHVQALVPKPQLMRANSLAEAAMQAGMIVGTGGAGFLFAWLGPRAGLAVDAATFIIAGVLVAAMARADVAPTQPSRSVWRSQLEGLAYIAGSPALVGSLVLIALPILCVQVDNVVLGVFARDALMLDAAGYGVLNLGYSLGAMLAGFTLAGLARRNAGTAGFIAAGLAALGIAHAALGASHGMRAAFVATALVGVSTVVSRTTLATRLMSQSRPEFGGRVQAAVVLMTSFIVLAAGLTIGRLANVVGYRATFWLLGGVIAACGVGALVGAGRKVGLREKA